MIKQKLIKQILILIVGIFLIGFITANILDDFNVFNNLDDAKEFIKTEKEKKQNYVNNLKLEYEYTSDKNCKYLYGYDDFICSVCYNLTKPTNKNGCVYLPPNSSREEDDNLIQKTILNILAEDFEFEEVEVNLREETNRRFNK